MRIFKFWCPKSIKYKIIFLNYFLTPLLCRINILKLHCPKILKQKPVLFIFTLSGLVVKKTYLNFIDPTEDLVHYVTLATIALKDGNLDKSEKILLKSLDLAETNNFSSGVISTCDILSSLSIILGNYGKAEDFLIRALDNLFKLGAPEDENSVVGFHLKLSRVYCSNGNDELAEIGFINCLNTQKKKLEKCLNEETYILWMTIQYWYGKFLLGKNRIEEAKSCFTECYQTSRKVATLMPHQLMVILYNLGEVCEILGEHDEALKYIFKAINVDVKFRNPDLPYFYNKLGRVFMAKELYEEAVFWYSQGKNLACKFHNKDAEKESNDFLRFLNKTVLE